MPRQFQVTIPDGFFLFWGALAIVILVFAGLPLYRGYAARIESAAIIERATAETEAARIRGECRL